MFCFHILCLNLKSHLEWKSALKLKKRYASFLLQEEFSFLYSAKITYLSNLVFAYTYKKQQSSLNIFLYIYLHITNTYMHQVRTCIPRT